MNKNDVSDLRNEIESILGDEDKVNKLTAKIWTFIDSRDSKLAKKPVMLERSNINVDGLETVCFNYIDYIYKKGESKDDGDFPHHIYEVALETIYGKKVWDFINARY